MNKVLEKLKELSELHEESAKLAENVSALNAKLDTLIKASERLILDAINESTRNESFYVESVLNKVCKVFNVSIVDIRTKSRKRELVQARHVYFWLLCKKTNFSLGKIGSSMPHGHNFEHSSVIHANTSVQKEVDLYLRKNIDQFYLASRAVKLDEMIKEFDDLILDEQ